MDLYNPSDANDKSHLNDEFTGIIQPSRSAPVTKSVTTATSLTLNRITERDNIQIYVYTQARLKVMN